MTKNDLLFRQVSPALMDDDGEPAYRAFRPGSNDNDQMSVDCSNYITAEDSYKLHLKKKRTTPDGTTVNLQSAGTWAVPRSSCVAEKLPVIHKPVKNDPLLPDNNAHHVVDFSSVRGKSARREVSQRLKVEAMKLGRQWPPEK